MEKVNLLKRVQNLKAAPLFEPYSKVIIHIDEDNQVSAGDNTGRVLEYSDPFGTKAQAESQLEQLKGFQYRPYQASGALLDPASEIGDAISSKSVYGGIYTRSRTFGRLMRADISAPYDEEVDHEYQYKSPSERKYSRELENVRASILIQSDRIMAEVAAESSTRSSQVASLTSQLSLQAGQIAAKVSQTGGNNSSFGWSLLANKFSLYAGSREVFKATSDGVVVDGQIRARSGYIGDQSTGFTITASSLYNGLSRFGGTQTEGVYIGTDGIQLGQNFKVDTSGNITATNIRLSGTLNIGGQNITAEALRSGAQSAYTNSTAWNGATGTVNTNQSYWSGGAAQGYNYGNATKQNTDKYPEFFSCSKIHIRNQYFWVHGVQVRLRTKVINGVQINYLGSDVPDPDS